MVGKIEGKRRREQQRVRWLDSITDATDFSLSKLQETVEDRGAQCAAVHGLQRVRHNLATERQQQRALDRIETRVFMWQGDAFVS